MRNGTAGVLAGVMMAMAATAASAADIVPVVVPAPVVVVVPPAPGFDWSGAYAGPIVGLYHPFEDRDALVLGGAAGFNIVRGPLIVGVEGQAAWFHYLGGGGDYFFGIARGRAGVRLGANDRVLLYGAAGGGFYTPSTAPYLTVAAGLEIGIGERLSLRSELTGFYYFPDFEAQWTTGIFWHFGR